MIVTAVSCSLEEKPYSITSEQLAETSEGAEQLVTGIYSYFWDSYMMKKTYMEWIDMDHDHAGAQSWVMSGAGEGNVTTHWGYNGNSDLWNVFYQMISRSNKAIEVIRESDSFKNNDPAIQQRYGEALFLRAWCYFHLVRMYGPVPLRLTYIQGNDMARSPVANVFNQITLDLENAIQYLRYPSDGYVGDWGHADKTAGQLLLAKVYCTMGSGSLGANGAQMTVTVNGTDNLYTCSATALEGYKDIDAQNCYQRARDLCDEVISRKGIDFDLMEGFTKLWGGNNYRNKEFVWGVASNANLDYHTEHLHRYYTLPPFGGNLYCFMSPELYKQYENTDERMIYGVFHWFGTSYPNTKNYGWVPYPNATEYPYEAMPQHLHDYAKFYGNFNKSTPGIAKWYTGDLTYLEPREDVDGNSTPQDVILIRYADAYLLKAEAEIELNNVDVGIEALNVIRDRAKASSYPDGLTKLEARSLVFKERGLEYVAEFNRKFDLLRWGLYLDVMNATNTVFAYGYQNSKIREPKCLLYAVPTVELKENTLFGPNNPGW